MFEINVFFLWKKKKEFFWTLVLNVHPIATVLVLQEKQDIVYKKRIQLDEKTARKFNLLTTSSFAIKKAGLTLPTN